MSTFTHTFNVIILQRKFQRITMSNRKIIKALMHRSSIFKTVSCNKVRVKWVESTSSVTIDLALER